jgi:hypothetical protein
VTLRSWRNMLADAALVDELVDSKGWDYKPRNRRERRQERLFQIGQWMHYYWPPTRGWSASLSLWWHYNVLRYPKPPPLYKGSPNVSEDGQ